MRIVVLTVAFCPAAQLGHMFLKFKRSSAKIYDHYVINGHYPLNEEKNTEHLRLITTAAGAKWMDPGEDIGSAQSQSWALEKLGLTDEDFFINLDPDSSCMHLGWDSALLEVLLGDPDIAISHLWSNALERETRQRSMNYHDKEITGIQCRRFYRNLQFNISMWRMSVIRKIGKIPQAYPWYGQVESPTQRELRRLKLYDGYLIDYIEEPIGKFFSDEVFQKWKYMHATMNIFMGKFSEFLKWIETPYGKEMYDKTVIQ